MDFAIPEELAQLRSSFGRFLEEQVRPVDERHREALQRGEVTDELRADAEAITRRSCAEGFYAAHMPESAGGWGLSSLGMTLLVEDAAASGLRMALHALGPPNPQGPSPLLLGLPEHLHQRYVAPLMTADATMCFALTEPEAGSDAQAIRTTAVLDGNEWVVNGTKHYITNGYRADFTVVFAVTDPDKRAHGGITALVVPREAYEVGKVQETMADTHPCELIFRDSRVPADHVIGEIGYGFYSAMSFLNAGRAFIGAQCLGLAQWCLSAAVEHAKSRTAFGEPIGGFQGVSFPLAECKVEIEAMRWLTYHLAWSVDQAAGADGGGLRLDSAVVKYFNSDRAFQVADRCLQVFGGQGLLKEGPIEAALRHLRMLRVVEGASEIQKLVIARALGL